MKRTIISSVVLVFLAFIIIVVYNYNIGTQIAVLVEPKIEKNDWIVLTSIKSDDTLNIIEVCYQEKYGLERVVFCTAIFENQKLGEYKCISPTLNLILQKSNLNSFQTKTVLKNKIK